MHLNQMNRMVHQGKVQVAWPLRFSYSRAIQNDAMEIWAGKPENVALAQEALLERARANAFAGRGALNPNFYFGIQAPNASKGTE